MTSQTLRNMMVQTLPGKTSLVIKIDPPMEDDERPLMLAFRGKHTAVMSVLTQGSVSITNPTDTIAMFTFAVGRQPKMPPEMLAAITAFFEARKKY